MYTQRSYWSNWSEILHRQGLAELAAWLLEAAGPLNILGAQMLYICQPFVSPSTSQGMRALALLLEQEDESRLFATLLKGKTE